MNHWKELVVWRKSHELVLLIYKVVATFPKNEQYALADQIKRAAASVPANIVEGHSRNSQKDFLRFLYIARGSLEELRYFLLLSKDLQYIDDTKYDEIEATCTQTSKLLNGLIKSLSKPHNLQPTTVRIHGVRLAAGHCPQARPAKFF